MKNDKKGAKLEVADMNIAFDHNGQVMKVQHLNPDAMPEIRAAKDIIKSNIG